VIHIKVLQVRVIVQNVEWIQTAVMERSMQRTRVADVKVKIVQEGNVYRKSGRFTTFLECVGHLRTVSEENADQN
jgi:hypothetical protein